MVRYEIFKAVERDDWTHVGTQDGHDPEHALRQFVEAIGPDKPDRPVSPMRFNDYMVVTSRSVSYLTDDVREVKQRTIRKTAPRVTEEDPE